MSNQNEWLREASMNCIPKIKQRDFEPVSQEAMEAKAKANAITLRLTYARWSEEERKALEEQRQEFLDEYHELLKNQINRP